MNLCDSNWDTFLQNMTETSMAGRIAECRGTRETVKNEPVLRAKLKPNH